MDINFHYFTVKALATKAGLDEETAQTIASYSQFVDDYNQFSLMHLGNVPAYAQEMVQYGLFNPVTTGFNSINNVWFTQSRYRVRILMPFHFIPEYPLKESPFHYRVKPYTQNGEDNTLLRGMLCKAREEYFASKANISFPEDGLTKEDQHKMSLMRIGILLHILADTYSHQGFSGGHGRENESELVSVVDSGEHSQERIDYYYPTFYHQLPSTGHANVSTAPDESNVSFTMKQHESLENPKYQKIYTRNNTDSFLETAEVIFNYLCSLCKHPMNKPDSFDLFMHNIRKGLNTAYRTDSYSFDTLKEHWNSIPFFADVKFSYDKNQLLDYKMTEEDTPMKVAGDFQKKNQSNDFYRYNTVAYEIRQQVTNGANTQSDYDQDETKLLKEISRKLEYQNSIKSN